MRQTARRYVQQHTMSVDLPAMPPAKRGGVTEPWFDDVALARCCTDPEYVATTRPDGGWFLNRRGCDFVASSEDLVAG